MKKRNGNKKINLPIRPIITFAAALLIFVLGAAYIWSLASSSEYFRVKYVLCKDGQLSELDYLEGRSIFDIDLRTEAQRILAYYPGSKQVRLLRSLPDRLFVDFVMRKPIALLRLSKYYIVDSEGVLYTTVSQAGDYDLPVITGLESKITSPRPGTRCDIREFRFALDMIKEANKGKIFKVYQVKRIDVKEATDVTLFVNIPTGSQSAEVPLGFLEVKIGEGGSREKMAMLAGLILASKSDLPNIKYMDLRFKEPVIKLKEKEK